MSASPPPSGAVGLARRIGPERAAALSGAWEAFWTSRLALWLVGLFAILKTGFLAGIVSPPAIAPFGGLGNLLVGPLARWIPTGTCTSPRAAITRPATPPSIPSTPCCAPPAAGWSARR